VIKDHYGQYIFDEKDITDMILKGIEFKEKQFIVNDISDLDSINKELGHKSFKQYIKTNIPLESFDIQNQKNWYMPKKYKDLDIAAYVLSLCKTDAELQRCGQELLMYQDRNLFDLLKFLTYLVDVMRENNIIWGVGRGSSVSSFVLYKLGVHRIDSMYYKLEIDEFLR